MAEIRISSWNELQDALYADSWRSNIRRHRSPYVFRGVDDAAGSLSTSLSRLGGNYTALENHLLRNFRKYAHREVVERDTPWHWLSLAQHHGLPTRLLDWSVSPLVGAHFATSSVETFHRDGAIWMVNHSQAHRMAPDCLKEELAREGAEYFTVDMLAKAVHSLRVLDELAPPHFVIFFEPPSMDERIVNQFALFSVMPDPQAALDTWLANHLDLWHKVIIPAEMKWEIRDRLDQANITERVLFPGLDGLSKWQKRYYTPRV